MIITDSKTIVLSELEIKKILAKEVASRVDCHVDVKNIKLDIGSDGPYESKRLRSVVILCETGKKEEEV